MSQGSVDGAEDAGDGADPIGGSGATDGYRYEPNPEDQGVEPYEVLVQWKRGEPHEHAETIDAPSDRMALMLAKRNVDNRGEPVSIWVVPRSAVTRTAGGDTTLRPSTDRSYRNVRWYAQNRVEVDSGEGAAGGEDA